MFARVPKLGLPKLLQKYLLFSEILDEDDDVFKKCVDTLIRGGADVNIQDNSGATALMTAAGKDCDKCVEYLIRAGADVNSQNNDGYSALMCAARWGCDKCVRMLIAAGASLNIQDTGGNTALGLAALYFFFNEKFIRLLILAGTANLQVGYGSRYVAENQNLLLAAGEKKAVRKYREPVSELHLSHLCRASIRKHLLQMSSMNLFARVPKLGLPKLLQKYLLFSEILDEDDEVFSICV